MSDENTVFCPYCGAVMQDDSAGMQHWFYCVNCNASSPFAKTHEEAAEKAKKLYKPFQKPLTLDELENYDMNTKFKDLDMSLKLAVIIIMDECRRHDSCAQCPFGVETDDPNCFDCRLKNNMPFYWDAEE